MHNIITTIYECSKCGSCRFENFSNLEYKGVRCLDCKHEKKEDNQYFEAGSNSITYSFTSVSGKVKKF